MFSSIIITYKILSISHTFVPDMELMISYDVFDDLFNILMEYEPYDVIALIIKYILFENNFIQKELYISIKIYIIFI